MQIERVGLQQRWQVSASTLRTALEYPSRAPISDPTHQALWDHGRLGAEIMPGLAGQSLDYRGGKIVTGASILSAAAGVFGPLPTGAA